MSYIRRVSNRRSGAPCTVEPAWRVVSTVFLCFGLARETVWRELCGSCRTVALMSSGWKASKLDQRNVSSFQYKVHPTVSLGVLHTAKVVECSKCFTVFLKHYIFYKALPKKIIYLCLKMCSCGSYSPHLHMKPTAECRILETHPLGHCWKLLHINVGNHLN